MLIFHASENIRKANIVHLILWKWQQITFRSERTGFVFLSEQVSASKHFQKDGVPNGQDWAGAVIIDVNMSQLVHVKDYPEPSG